MPDRGESVAAFHALKRERAAFHDDEDPEAHAPRANPVPPSSEPDAISARNRREGEITGKVRPRK